MLTILLAFKLNRQETTIISINLFLRVLQLNYFIYSKKYLSTEYIANNVSIYFIQL